MVMGHVLVQDDGLLASEERHGWVCAVYSKTKKALSFVCFVLLHLLHHW